jgi:2',3'-cyclic-nucleotide 2'-phosphodiesterase (5'-nucleotidase family)
MPKGGLAGRATAITLQRRAAPGSVLVLDSGDTLFVRSMNAIPADSKQGGLLVAAMNAMGYDAMALGTTDLAPLPVVKARFEEADFALLSANVGPDGALPNVQPYLLRQVEDHTVAIIGITAPEAQERAQAYEMGLTIADPVAAVRRTVQEVRRWADIIILLGNLDQETNIALAQEVAGLDAIVGLYQSGQIRATAVEGPEGTVVLQASGVSGEYLGVLTLHLDAAGRVASFTEQALPLQADIYADDPAMMRLMREYVTKP